MSDMEIQEIRELDGGSLMGYLAKGQHDAIDFANLVAIEYETLIDGQQVTYRWFRWTPAVWFDSPPPQCLLDAQPHTRGAFLATWYAADIHGVSDVPASWRDERPQS